MADDTRIFTLSEQSIRDMRRMRDEIASLRHDVASLRRRSGTSYPAFVRTGTAYDTIGPASSTAPTRGYITLDNIDLTNQLFAETESDRVYAYNLGPGTITAGDRVAVGLHLPSYHDGDPRPVEAVWVLMSVDTSDPDPDFTKLIYLCKEANQAIAVGTEVKMTFQESRNFSTANHTPYDSGAAFDGIVMKKIGWYLFGYDISWTGPFTSPGSPGDGVQINNSGKARLGFSEDGTGSTTIVPCSYKVVSSIKDLPNGTGLDGNASHTTLYQNTVENRVMHLLLESVSSFAFPANHNVFRAQYLHNLAVTETAP